MKITYKVKDEINIEQISKGVFHMSQRLFTKLKKEHIFLNGDLLSPHQELKKDDIIEYNFDYEEDSENIVPNNSIKLDILFEDEWLLVVNKPANLPVHPSMSHYTNSLSNGVKSYFNSIQLHKKIRPVNRLDKNTSGIVIFAKCEYIQEKLIYEMKSKAFKKEYIAILDGELHGNGTISKAIKRKLTSIIEREIDESPDASPAITHYNVIKNFTINNNIYTLVKFILETGKTHQIRVHSKSINHPILGDSLYGKESNLISRQALHASHITFVHPITNQTINIDSPIPDDMNIILNG